MMGSSKAFLKAVFGFSCPAQGARIFSLLVFLLGSSTSFLLLHLASHLQYFPSRQKNPGNIGSEWWQESIDMMPSSARPSLVVCSPRHLNIASKRDTTSSIDYQFIMVNG